MELENLLDKLRLDHLESQLYAVCEQTAKKQMDYKLAIALGVKAMEAEYSVLFLTLEQLMTRLMKAFSENRLERTLQQLSYPKVLITDEIGYLPLSNTEASLFFRLVARRYKYASLIVTNKKSFIDWDEVFTEERLTAALLDRLTYHAYIVELVGVSYRFRQRMTEPS